MFSYLNQWSLPGGTLLAGLATALGIGWLSRREAIREDTAIEIVFTGMFALGVLPMFRFNQCYSLNSQTFSTGVYRFRSYPFLTTTLG
ncbi:MAG: hypothetical protein HC828_12525 [Blastochloris sp.]|nr:hypothetical protein [Blastochloris sp.]